MNRAERVHQFIVENMVAFDDAKRVSFRNDDNIFELGFIDSMLALKLVTFIEKEFGLTVDNNDLDIVTFSTVDNIVRFIERKLGT